MIRRNAWIIREARENQAGEEGVTVTARTARRIMDIGMDATIMVTTIPTVVNSEATNAPVPETRFA